MSDDLVEGAVELAVAAAVEAVADGLAGGGGDRGGAGEAGEGSLAGEPSVVRPGEHDLRGQERADAGLVEQLRSELAGELFDLAGEFAFLGGQLLDAPRDGFEGELGAAELGVVSAVGTGCGRGERAAGPGSGRAVRCAAARAW